MMAVDSIAMYLGYSVMILSFLVGVIFICTFLLAKIGDKFPHFIGYKSLMKMNDYRFERWVETLRYMREKRITKYSKRDLKC